MKMFQFVMMFVLLSILCGCADNPAVVDDNSNTVVVEQPVTKVKEVVINFAIHADYPAGSLSPDAVFMDNKPLPDGAKILTGAHTFVVEKKGYKKQTRIIEVNDPENDGVFTLSFTMEAKERVVLIDVTDKLTGKPITPDQVVASQSAEGEGQVISHQALIKPGNKKLIIQKAGYQTISEDINVRPEEEPFVIQYQLLPLK